MRVIICIIVIAIIVIIVVTYVFFRNRFRNQNYIHEKHEFAEFIATISELVAKKHVGNNNDNLQLR